MTEKEGFQPKVLINPSVLEQKDVDSINKLRRQLKLSSESITDIEDLAKSRVTDILCQPNCRMIIFKDSATDEVIGMTSLFYHQTFGVPDGLGKIEDVVVDERYRGKGLGKLLVIYVFSIAQNLGLRTLELTSNPKRVEANKMYVELGFELYGTNFYTKDL